ncbi:MAG: PGF-pre-PGF domain-containing protein, partial [Candidatus Pacearchaeota archaeon]
MLKFNVSNTSVVNGTGEAISNITINNTGSALGYNVTNVTISNGNWTYYNDSFSGRLANISINENITGEMNLTINYTINSTSADGETVQVNVAQISSGTNVSHSSVPFSSSVSTIDSVASALNYSSNGTLANNSDNTGNLSVNVTTSDASLDTINISVNGSVVKSCSSSPCGYTNNSQDGVYEFNASYNTSTGKSDSTNTRVVTIDNTNPSPSASCNDVNEGENLDCSCSATDNLGSSVSTSTSTNSDSGTGTQNNVGDFTFTCSATDNAGNSASATAGYTINSVSSGGSSGSSGGASESKSHGWSSIKPGKAEVMKDFSEDLGVKQISIKVNNPAQNVVIDVKKYDGKPADVSVEKSGKVYQYLEIDTQNLNENLDKATISVKVEKSWIKNNSISAENVVVSKFDESSGNWNDLETSFTHKDEEFYYYKAEVDGFSYFSIGEKSDSDTNQTDSTSGKDTSRDLGEKDGKTAGGTTNQAGEGFPTWAWIVIAVVLIGLVVWFVWNKNSK